MRVALIVAGSALAAIGIFWPWLAKLPLGRLPGDIRLHGAHGAFYFPVVTCILISAALSFVLWLIDR
jgi:hypothetical protein